VNPASILRQDLQRKNRSTATATSITISAELDFAEPCDNVPAQHSILESATEFAAIRHGGGHVLDFRLLERDDRLDQPPAEFAKLLMQVVLEVIGPLSGRPIAGKLFNQLGGLLSESLGRLIKQGMNFGIRDCTSEAISVLLDIYEVSFPGVLV